MARLSNRYNPLLKSYPESEKINSVSEGAEVLYVRLIAACDDMGRYWGDAGWILNKLFTARAISGTIRAEELEQRLCELEQTVPEPLIRRYTVGKMRYLEVVNVHKSLRSDVSPQILFPEPLPESVPERPAPVPPTSTSNQTKPTTTSTSTSEDADVQTADVDGSFQDSLSDPETIDWENFDWEGLKIQCTAMKDKLKRKGTPPLSMDDRDEIVKSLALLKVGAIHNEWYQEAMAYGKRRSTKKPFPGFHRTLFNICKENGVNLNRLYKHVTHVPAWLTGRPEMVET